ncbi:YbhB/YbcL family Raf kinase inhibitor-like protein [Shewanella sp. GXUN23E]|uniref:YbhB/YbcL family Raf kinase inhibitor-like protein n=1 Tax=Shewanella sp. GXUN23E TaxID=3422498 RepID=UPI003D7E226F
MHTGIKLLTLSGLLLSSVTCQALTLSSDSVTNDQSFRNQQIFNQWGCTGDNISPQLSWSDVPEGTRSFALTMYDPDAPTGSGWWHWLVINLPADSRSLPAGAGDLGKSDLPKGASMVTNDFGFKGYGGACPPPDAKPHQYHITLYALDTDKIELPGNATAALAGYNILQHVLAKSVLTAPTNAR